LTIVALLAALSTSAFADAPKVQRQPRKLDREARVYVMDKDAPSIDKTVTLARPRATLSSKDK
jgi:hypothetical protein